MRLVCALFALAGLVQAQDIHVTADLLSAQTAAAMFGKLPKPYSAASVSICNNTSGAVTIPLARAAQQVRTSGFILIPKNAALSVLAASQGSTIFAKSFRAGVAAIELAGIAAGWSGLSTAIKNTLTSSALAGSSALGVFSTAIPTHTYLTFSNEALPDPLSMVPLGCVTGVVIVESAGKVTSIDASFSVQPSTEKK